jgi:hypothetical protein
MKLYRNIKGAWPSNRDGPAVKGLLQRLRYFHPRHGGISFQADALPRELVHHCQNAERTAIGELVAHKIHAPTLVRRRRGRYASTLTTHSKAVACPANSTASNAYTQVKERQSGPLESSTMAERFTRKTLYDLVWSEPMKTLSARFGISDVALKKTCERVGIPTPERGYWAKKDAGRETFQAAFPLRPPGMGGEVEVGGGGNASYGYRNNEEFLKPIGPPPDFSEAIETVRARIVEQVGKVTVPKKVLTWHKSIDRILKEDEKRREKVLSTSNAALSDSESGKPRQSTPTDR